jgi:hypothetical protein
MHISGERYGWLDPDYPIADAPDWMKEEPRVHGPIVVRPPRFTNGMGTKKGLRLLEKQLAILRGAEVGERNHTLNRCAFIVALAVERGELQCLNAQAQLIRVAIARGLTDEESRRTTASAFRSTVVRSGRVNVASHVTDEGDLRRALAPMSRAFRAKDPSDEARPL